MEVAAEQCPDTESGCVIIGWDRDTSIWDFPRNVYNRVIELEKSCLPIRFVAAHSCCPSSVYMKIMVPVILALTDRRARSRVVVHNVPVSEIIIVLSAYGIQREMLPTIMGGTVELDQQEWIVDRRAAELYEIA